MVSTAPKSEFVEALAKGLAVLESFDGDHPQMTLSEVARKTGSSPATARRSLLTLMQLGYVGQEKKRFHLRPKVMTLGSAFHYSARIDEVLNPELRHFVQRFGDACSVAALEGDDIIYVAHHSEQRAARPWASVGARYPAYAASLGRVLLGSLSDAEINSYFDGLEAKEFTAKTVTDVETLRGLVLQAREDDFAVCVDQLGYGITALAVPIRGVSGKVIAALNTSGYTGMVTPEDLVRDRLGELRIMASQISQSFRRFPLLENMISTGR